MCFVYLWSYQINKFLSTVLNQKVRVITPILSNIYLLLPSQQWCIKKKEKYNELSCML